MKSLITETCPSWIRDSKILQTRILSFFKKEIFYSFFFGKRMGILMIGMRGKISTETQIFFLVSLMFYANNIKEMLLWSFCSF